MAKQNPESTLTLDVFNGPVTVRGQKEAVFDALMRSNDQFFDAFEECLSISVILNNPKDGKYQCMVHFYVSDCDDSRRGMFRGWVYGYLTALGLEWDVAGCY